MSYSQIPTSATTAHTSIIPSSAVWRRYAGLSSAPLLQSTFLRPTLLHLGYLLLFFTVTMAPRPLFAFASLIFIAGGCLLIFLVLLAGAINGDPVNQIYFLQADTSGISGAPALSRWTLWNTCPVGANNLDSDCGVSPAYPFDPQNNFGTQKGVPATFIGTSKFYYMSRFMFAFILIALFFGVCSLFLGLFALCSRIGSYLSSVTCMVALFFETIVACLLTANYVIGRNNFQANGMAASIGTMAFGFIWAAMACFFLATLLLCMAGVTSKSGGSSSGRRFGRKRSARSRGSFIDTESQRRVKDEYV